MDNRSQIEQSVCQESFAVCSVRRKHEKNATSMARRFSSLAGLKLLVKNELTASATAREKALKTLQDITDVYHERPDSLVEQVTPSQKSSLSDALPHGNLRLSKAVNHVTWSILPEANL